MRAPIIFKSSSRNRPTMPGAPTPQPTVVTVTSEKRVRVPATDCSRQGNNPGGDTPPSAPSKDMRSRGSTEGSSRRHISSVQLLSSSSKTPLTTTTSPCDILSPPKTNESSRLPPKLRTPSQQALRELRPHQTIERRTLAPKRWSLL